jgi:hypothetical protein
LGELQHGVYDDECEGLTEEEINAFYGFEEDGELQVLDETLINQMRMTVTTMEIWRNLKWMRNGLNLKTM